MKPALTLPLLLAGMMTLGGASDGPPSPSPSAVDGSEVFDVTMVEKGPMDMRFEPSDLKVRQGDVLRFVQLGVQPHNVAFTGTPEGMNLRDLGDLGMGPFLTQKGQVYEIVIDERFLPGEYDFVCTPHIPMGMTGTITVLSDDEARDR